MKNTKSLKSLVEWFNQINDDKRKYILESMDNNYQLIIDKQDFNNFKFLRDKIIEIILNGLDEEKIIKKLITSGLEELSARNFYTYCNFYAKPMNDSKILKIMDLDNFIKTVDFVFDNMFFYYQIEYYSPEKLIKVGGFNNSDEARKAIRFIYNYVSRVLDRKISPSFLSNILEVDFDIPKSLIDALIGRIDDNLTSLREARLMTKLIDVEEKIDSFDNNIELDQE